MHVYVCGCTELNRKCSFNKDFPHYSTYDQQKQHAGPVRKNDFSPETETDNMTGGQKKNKVASESGDGREHKGSTQPPIDSFHVDV